MARDSWRVAYDGSPWRVIRDSSFCYVQLAILDLGPDSDLLK